MDSLIRFRVATKDKAEFEAAAERDGVSLSDWVRSACRLMVDTSEAMERILPADDMDEHVRKAAPKIKERVVGLVGSIRDDEITPTPTGAIIQRRPDPDKIAEFQRKAGMAGGKGKR